MAPPLLLARARRRQHGVGALIFLLVVFVWLTMSWNEPDTQKTDWTTSTTNIVEIRNDTTMMMDFDDIPTTIPLCDPTQLGNGSWIPVEKGLHNNQIFRCCEGKRCNPSHLDIHGKGCLCQQRRPSNESKVVPGGYRTFQSLFDYDWIPMPSCTLPQFVPNDFCAMISPNKTILFTGDSLMRQMFGGLSSVLYHANVSCWQQFMFQDSDTLINEKLGSGTHNRGKPLNETIMAWLRGDVNFTVNALMPVAVKREMSNLMIITQAGAHVQGSDINEAKTRARRVAERIVAWKHEFNVQMLWVTQLFGHSSCAASIEPFQSHQQVIDAFGKHDRYHHAWYFEKNQVFLDVMRQGGIPIVDMTALRYRPDSHAQESDCLHQCVPGPMTYLFPRVLMRVWEDAMNKGIIDK